MFTTQLMLLKEWNMHLSWEAGNQRTQQLTQQGLGLSETFITMYQGKIKCTQEGAFVQGLTSDKATDRQSQNGPQLLCLTVCLFS